MNRLTVDKPASEMSMIELAHNCCFAKNKEAYYRDFDREERLRDWIRKLEMKMRVTGEARLPKDDAALDEELFDNLQYPIADIAGNTAFIYRLMLAMADLREVLKGYEDIGLTPEQVRNQHNNLDVAYKIINRYEVIGTPEELRALKEKAEPVKVEHWQDDDTFECSCCGLDATNKDYDYCHECGSLFGDIEEVTTDTDEPRFLLDMDSICYGCKYYVSADEVDEAVSEDNVLCGGVCDCNEPCYGGNMNGYRMEG